MSSGNGTNGKSAIDPEDIRIQEGKRYTTKEKCLLCFVLILVVAVAVLAALFAVFYSKAKDADDEKVCTSRNCIVAAASMAVQMDHQVDPCHDFAMFACGGFRKNHVIPDGENEVSVAGLLTKGNTEKIRNLLQGKIHNDEKEYEKKMKTYYQMCMDEAKIEDIGLKPFLDTKQAKDWPSRNPTWDSSRFDLNTLLQEYARIFVEPLVASSVSTDLHDSNKHTLYLFQPSLGMSLKNMKLPRNSPSVMAYQQFYVDVAVALGADRTTAETDAIAVVDFEQRLANISVTDEEMIDLASTDHPTTLHNMTRDYPYIDWQRLVQAAFDNIGKNIPGDLVVNNNNPPYFSRLDGVLKTTPSRVIQNLFGFRLADKRVSSLTKEMRAIRLEMNKVILGIQSEYPRWRQCISLTTSLFWHGMAKKYVSENFSEKSKAYVITMVEHLKTAFSEMINEADWMQPETKKAALRKIKTLTRKIGYPDKDFSEEYIENKYKNTTLYGDQFYKTLTEGRTMQNFEGMENLYKPVDKDKWSINPMHVNAYYSPSKNTIAFTAGILQPPHFSYDFPSLYNYGAVGTIIGHEITHGFDQSGSQYDHLGNRKNWWASKDLVQFKARTQCVIDQYGNITVEEVGMKINGLLTAGENTADIGGLKASHRAYKAYAATVPEELALPGLGLTKRQQYFLALGQMLCSKGTDDYLKNHLRSDPHSPDRYRINGFVRNNDDFARAYNCPVGSPMNPAKKCAVW